MKKIASFAAALAFAASVGAFAAPIALPSPKKSGGISLLEALSKRSSAKHTSFAKGPLSLEDLSTLLWATTGKNREPVGWTVPMARDKEPYVSVYVLLESGAYLYDWGKNQLTEVNTEKNLITNAVLQDFAKTAPCALVFVDSGNAGDPGLAEIAAGAMSQNTYLVVETLGLKGRYLASYDGAFVSKALKIKSADSILGVMVVGKQ